MKFKAMFKQFNLIFFMLFVIQQLHAQIPSNGLVAWYPFNGNANDESGNGNHGTVNGATLTTDRNGNINSAFSFDGVVNSIVTSGNFCSNFNQGEISVSIWSNSEIVKNQSLFEEIPNNPNVRINAHLNHNNLGAIFWDFGNINNGGRISSVVSSCILNQWEHYVFVASSISGQMTVYRNGIQIMTGVYGSNYSSTGEISIGGNPSYFQGKIDDLSFFNRSLTYQEIQQLYQDQTGQLESTLTCSITSSNTTPCAGESVTLSVNTTGGDVSSLLPANLQTGLVGYYPFNGNANDESGNGNNGAVSGAILSADRFGNVANSFSFSAPNDVITLPSPIAGTYSNAMSYSCWFYETPVNEFMNVLNVNGKPLVLNPNSSAIRAGDGNSFHVESTNSDLDNPGWKHICVVYLNDIISIYVNGILSVSETTGFNFPISYASASSALGSTYLQGGQYPFTGKIDDIAIYNRVLTPAEIQQLYSGISYSWSNGGQSASTTVNPTQNTTYSCAVTKGTQSCTASLAITAIQQSTWYPDNDGDGYGVDYSLGDMHQSITDFPGGPTTIARAVSNSQFGFVLGGATDGGVSQNCWRLDPTTNQWSAIAQLPYQGNPSIVFSYNENLYIYDEVLYQYSTAQDNWSTFQQIPDFGQIGYNGSCFVIGHVAYFVFANNVMISWNFITQQWNHLSNFPGQPRAICTSFAINGKGYYGMGYYTSQVYDNDLWEYDPNTDSWTQKSDLPSFPRYGCTAVVQGGRAYFLGGEKASPNPFLNEVWMYNPATDVWTAQDNYPAGSRNYVTAFVVNGHIYSGLGSSGYHTDFWKWNNNAYACSQPAGFVSNTNDCNDTEVLAYTGAQELCGNGVDEDCNGADDVCPVPGCMDPVAFNYNPLANVNDGSCLAVMTCPVSTTSTTFCQGDSFGASVTVNAASLSKPTYTVGDVTPSGGIVFYDKGNEDGGWRYLEVTPNDVAGPSANVSCYCVPINGTISGYGAGYENSIIWHQLGCSNPTTIPNPPATVIGGYSGWYLPSALELELIYDSLRTTGLEVFSSGDYWTSNPGSNGSCGIDGGALVLNFTSGQWGTQYRSGYEGSGYARFVRRFIAEPVVAYSWNLGTINADSISLVANTNTNLISVSVTSGPQTCNAQLSITVNPLQSWFLDADGDGFGNSSSVLSVCIAPSTYVTNGDDCNDSDGTVAIISQELCGNGVDEDCNGSDLACFNSIIDDAVQVNSIGNYGTGTQTSWPIDFSAGADYLESSEIGLDLWFRFTALNNAVRIELSGSTMVGDDNQLMLYDFTTALGQPLIPLKSENDVSPFNMGISNDGGNEILLFDQLQVGNEYWLCVHNVNDSYGMASLRMAYLRGSAMDIGPYTNYTNTYNSTCQNFKCKFRQGASHYTFHMWNGEQAVGDEHWLFSTTPLNTAVASTVLSLGKLVVANMNSTIQQAHTVMVDAHYNLKDAFGNNEPLTANGVLPGVFWLNPEQDLNLRASDRCPVSKSPIYGAVATNRSVCGVSRYIWSFQTVQPQLGLTTVVNGSLGGSRVLSTPMIPGITNNQTYDVMIRSLHIDQQTLTNYGTVACMKTFSVAGSPVIDVEEAYIQENRIILYPNPTTTGSFVLQYNEQETGDEETSNEERRELVMMDITGKVVFKTNVLLNGNIAEIHFGDLESGLYLVDFGGERTRVQVMK